MDTADYSLATLSGVKVVKDDVPFDGRVSGATTLDRDTIRPDVERLVGSCFDDFLQGTGAGLNLYDGRAGNDVMNGLGGQDVFEMGTQADGADRISGGSGTDTVSYEQRNNPVNVTLTNGVADDGQRNEGDEIDSAEIVKGGRADDILVAIPSSTAGFSLEGRPATTISRAETVPTR